MNGTCFECKFMRNRTDLEPCEHCTNTFAMTGVHPSFTLKKPPTTNADKIRAMTDEELAELLTDVGVRTLRLHRLPVAEPVIEQAKEDWLNWLKQEANDAL